MKKGWLIGMLVVLSLHQVCNAARIAQWTFDNPEDIGNDSAGSFDLVANTDYAAPVYNAAGKAGGAAYFSTNSCLVTPAGIYSNKSFTFTAWVKPDNTNVNALAASAAGRGGFQVYAAGGKWRVKINKQDATFSYSIGEPVTEEWTHIAVTYSAAGGASANRNYTGTLKLYINGKYISGKSEASYCANETYTMRLGTSSAGAKFSGLMDQVEFYDTALSAPQIAELAAP